MQLTSDPARREVTPLELFFDLVYVFAIGQLSHRLLVHPTWTGAAHSKSAVSCAAVFGTVKRSALFRSRW
ncbi:low temperature requirement protein A [Streptomyces vastus]|uniref:Low temperature requirement protein A n=1 Tax=Streptomyces vastus TaxID=285451 RepID=A0ABN3R5H0_9ACTN